MEAKTDLFYKVYYVDFHFNFTKIYQEYILTL